VANAAVAPVEGLLPVFASLGRVVGKGEEGDIASGTAVAGSLERATLGIFSHFDATLEAFATPRKTRAS
jgi:hypothetical protein